MSGNTTRSSLLATVGMMFLVSAEKLLMIISLELTSLSLYILTAFNKHNIKSAEALKLSWRHRRRVRTLGLSLIYGLSGRPTGRSPRRTAALDPLLICAVVMTARLQSRGVPPTGLRTLIKGRPRLRRH